MVRFQTFGHIHPEEYSVTRSLTSNKPIGIEYIAGNSGTFETINPTVRQYEMNLDYHVPQEVTIYRTLMEESNKKD